MAFNLPMTIIANQAYAAQQGGYTAHAAQKSAMSAGLPLGVVQECAKLSTGQQWLNVPGTRWARSIVAYSMDAMHMADTTGSQDAWTCMCASEHQGVVNRHKLEMESIQQTIQLCICVTSSAVGC